MADYKKLVPHILKWEGGFVDDPMDRGGATNKGVTIATFRQYYGASASVSALKNMTDSQWEHIFLIGYWNPWRAYDIENQSIANLVVDWAWHSGTRNSIRRVQSLLGVTADGVVGPVTLSAINDRCARELFNTIHAARLAFFDALVAASPSQSRFINGWRNRVNSITFSCK